MQKLKRVSLHRATDRRCYHGCPSDDLAREWKSKDDAKEYLATLGLRVTYYPAGAFYVGFHGNEIVTPDCSSYEAAANMAMDHLEKTDNGE